MKPKYKFTDKTLTNEDGKVLHQIVALKDFGSVKEGDVGGWIEDERNLSHDGNCWVYDDARAYDNALVCGNARVYENARVYGKAQISGNARVCDDARVSDYAHVSDNAQVYGYVNIFGNARVFGSAQVLGNTHVYGNAKVYGNARIFNTVCVYGDAHIYGYVNVFGSAQIYDGKITKPSDFVCVGPQGSRSRYTTYNRLTNNVACGCFKGSLEEFKTKVEETYPDKDNEYRQQYDRVIKTFNIYKIKTL